MCLLNYIVFWEKLENTKLIENLGPWQNVHLLILLWFTVCGIQSDCWPSGIWWWGSGNPGGGLYKVSSQFSTIIEARSSVKWTVCHHISVPMLNPNQTNGDNLCCYCIKNLGKLKGMLVFTIPRYQHPIQWTEDIIRISYLRAQRFSDCPKTAGGRHDKGRIMVPWSGGEMLRGTQARL